MDSPKDNPEYLKINEAARFLGVNPRTVYRRVWSGDIPAAKVGGLYFIKRSDLEALLGPKQPGRELTLAGLDTAPLKCGYCSRLLTSDSLIGEACQEEGCTEIICTSCLADGISTCVRHIPDREERWQEALKRKERGDYSLLVKGVYARLRESNFLSRIRTRLENITTLMHPQSGELLTIPDWNVILEAGDERAEVMRLLGKVMLDASTTASTPLNASLLYHLPQPKNGKGRPVSIQVKALSRLAVMARTGFDTRPLGVEDLTPRLMLAAEESTRQQMFTLLVLASSTGWDSEARKVIQGQAGSRGELAFMHDLTLYYLFDLERGDLIYNTADERARRYAELFVPMLVSEEVDEAVKAVEKELTVYDSLTLQYAVRVLPYAEGLLRQAFERLAGRGRYALTEVGDLGLAIVRQ